MNLPPIVGYLAEVKQPKKKRSAKKVPKKLLSSADSKHATGRSAMGVKQAAAKHR